MHCIPAKLQTARGSVRNSTEQSVFDKFKTGNKDIFFNTLKIRIMHPKNKFTKAKSHQVLLRQIQEICMLDNDINMLKMTICAKAGSNKICAKAGSNKMEVTKRLVDTTAHYIMDCYQEAERQLVDM